MGPPARGGKKRRVGAGVGLDKLAAGRRSTYDPRVSREKERNIAAGRVNKYRKLKARVLASQPKPLPVRVDESDEDQSGKRRSKPASASERFFEDRGEGSGASSDDASSSSESDDGARGVGRRSKRDVGTIRPDSWRLNGGEGEADDGPGSPSGSGGLGDPGASDSDGEVRGRREKAAAREGEPGRDEAGAAAKGGRAEKKSARPRRPPTAMERLAEKARAERREKDRARAEARKAAEEQAEARRRATERRDQARAAMRKRTRGGQPVMKARLEGMLAKLQAESGRR